MGRDRTNPLPPQTNQLRSQARWTYLNRKGHHPYVPYVSHHHLNSNRGGFTPWIDAPPRNDPQSRLVTVCVTNQPPTNRPVGRVRPRIRIPDSATNTDLETISESDLADDVGMNGVPNLRHRGHNGCGAGHSAAVADIGNRSIDLEKNEGPSCERRLTGCIYNFLRPLTRRRSFWGR